MAGSLNGGEKRVQRAPFIVVYHWLDGGGSDLSSATRVWLNAGKLVPLNFTTLGERRGGDMVDLNAHNDHYRVTGIGAVLELRMVGSMVTCMRRGSGRGARD